MHRRPSVVYDKLDKSTGGKTKYGTFAYFFTVGIFLTSLPWVRRRFYSVFYVSHFAFVAVYVCVWLHVPRYFLPYLATIGTAYLLDRLVRVFWGLYPVRMTQFRLIGNKRNAVRIRFPKHPVAVCT
jgi:hypothetical protein